MTITNKYSYKITNLQKLLQTQETITTSHQQSLGRHNKICLHCPNIQTPVIHLLITLINSM